MFAGLMMTIVEQVEQAAGSVSGAINYSITIGDLLTIATTIVSIAAAYTRLTDRLKALEVKSDVLWDDYRRRSRHTRE